MTELLGKKVSFIPCAFTDARGVGKAGYQVTATGTVTYVNEEHDYFTITYQMYGETFRESFKSSQIGKDVTIRGR